LSLHRAAGRAQWAPGDRERAASAWGLPSDDPPTQTRQLVPGCWQTPPGWRGMHISSSSRRSRRLRSHPAELWLPVWLAPRRPPGGPGGAGSGPEVGCCDLSGRRRRPGRSHRLHPARPGRSCGLGGPEIRWCWRWRLLGAAPPGRRRRRTWCASTSATRSGLAICLSRGLSSSVSASPRCSLSRSCCSACWSDTRLPLAMPGAAGRWVGCGSRAGARTGRRSSPVPLLRPHAPPPAAQASLSALHTLDGGAAGGTAAAGAGGGGGGSAWGERGSARGQAPARPAAPSACASALLAPGPRTVMTD